MAIKVLELVTGHTIICEVTATVIPVTEEGKELEPILYFQNPAELLISFDYERAVHRVHIVEWMAYVKTKPEYISSTVLAFKPQDPDEDVLRAYEEKLAFDVLSTSKNYENEAEPPFSERSFEKKLETEKAIQLLNSIDKNPKKVIN